MLHDCGFDGLRQTWNLIAVTFLLPHLEDACVSPHKALELAFCRCRRNPQFRALYLAEPRDQRRIDGVILGPHLALPECLGSARIHDGDLMTALVKMMGKSLPVRVRCFHARPQAGLLPIP